MLQDPRRPPVLDMTPEGEFRDPAPPPHLLRGGSWLDRALLRLGGLSILAAVVVGGLVMAASAVLILGLLIPVALVMGLVAFGTLWWRARRAGRGGPATFIVLRR
ncbi:cbb3-type cytochrome oxidase assembly protein [Muricoccus radiodurans]|uniref:cbb3-type cytochrome oxidase assembly protein n=1 Tax=Muricoccus radiodurans TaxID=2231721 RepID=UPI003CEDC5C0